MICDPTVHQPHEYATSVDGRPLCLSDGVIDLPPSDNRAW